MNKDIQSITVIVEQSKNLSDEEKSSMLLLLKKANKELELTAFKLERTEKVKYTTGILLEETIEELEQKRKAVESQNRELEIEAALNNVRSRSLAMQKSEELGETAYLLFNQLLGLGEIPDQVTIGLIKEEERSIEFWITMDGNQVDRKVQASIDEPTVMNKIFVAWKDQKKSILIDISGQQLQDFIQYRMSMSQSSELQRAATDIKENRRLIYAAFFSKGFITFSSSEPKPIESYQIVERFAHAFDGTYTRFLDLQKAEAQAREAMIEAGLERVRSKTMSMHNSQDVGETVALMFEELVKLEVKTNRCGILIISNSMTAEVWTAKSNPNGKASLIIGKLDLTMHPLLQGFYHAWENKESVFTYPMIGDDLISYYHAINNTKLYPTLFDLNALPSKEFHTDFYFAEGSIFSFTDEILTEEAIIIFKRFAGVFGQTYRRYLDLQKAEARAKEAQVEAALERVRSKTMAMHNSQDVGETVVTLFDELVKLGLDELIRCGIGIMQEPNIMEAWTASKTNETKSELVIGRIDMNIHPLMQGCFDGWKYKKEVFQYILEGDDKINYYNIINVQPNYNARRDIATLSDRVVLTAFYFNEGCLYAFSIKELSSETANIFIRFVTVFGQTYRRYLDLQKAEAQAREAQIETALEKVRSRSLAMQKGNEIVEVLVTIQEKLVELNVNFDSVNIIIFSKLTKDVKYWTVISKELKYINFNFPYVDYSVSKDFSIARANHMNIFSKCYSGAEKDELLYYLFEQTDFRNLSNERKEYLKVSENFTITIGIGDQIGIQLNSYTRKFFTDEENAILIKFTKVFEQAYIRFLDIQNAEVQALEALKRASVDRVRAEIASMRTSTDLERITPIIWSELTTLGVPFIRCGVFIMDEENQQIQTMLSTAEGKAIASFQLPYENSEPLTELIPHWRKMKIYLESWDEKTFVESTKILLQKGAISSSETYATEHPPTNLHLHFLPFLQGMLYVGNEAALNQDELHLVQNLADAFSIAYARYEDFNKLESAKEQIEKTLKDLKATQSLLIQSEKMASLGELTAGIAHEIQNPLNFVNNFSEVSTELVDEMNEEIQKGNLEDAQQIAADLKDNLSKINHHGKRAGDIVRGMLQHSRSSSGQKEPTDINALADEYLRLAYHGLRAKDKSFNATMNTDFDQSIGTIKIIPQDIGRVILNLITNAFYVVNEKVKSGIENYAPTVFVSTKKIGNKVLISVKDNGNGIPQKVLDKIFQPFFTTKPTGQGTGLGLSLSYDIVKAHGGNIQVETKEGEGTEFMIQLPS